MLRRSITIEALSQSVGVDKGQISRFRSGQFKTWSKNLQKICENLQIQDNVVTGGNKTVSNMATDRRMETTCPLNDVLTEVQSVWEHAGDKRDALRAAILAIVKIVV
jgi:transcriptional regulator with XRE-family HTH domain